METLPYVIIISVRLQESPAVRLFDRSVGLQRLNIAVVVNLVIFSNANKILSGNIVSAAEKHQI